MRLTANQNAHDLLSASKRRLLMTDLPKCTKCGSVHTYENGSLYICPECGHEWTVHHLPLRATEGLLLSLVTLDFFQNFKQIKHTKTQRHEEIYKMPLIIRETPSFT